MANIEKRFADHGDDRSLVELADRICSGKRNGEQTLFSRANLPMKVGL